jgi:hypothetical protein
MQNGHRYIPFPQNAYRQAFYAYMGSHFNWTIGDGILTQGPAALYSEREKEWVSSYFLPCYCFLKNKNTTQRPLIFTFLPLLYHCQGAKGSTGFNADFHIKEEDEVKFLASSFWGVGYDEPE